MTMYHPNQRNKVNEWTKAERMIQDSVDEVEGMGCDVLLTDAVILLGKARDKVGECIHNREQALKGSMPKIVSDQVEPLGTPVSQLSGRPGHAGFDRFCEIAQSWGYD